MKGQGGARGGPPLARWLLALVRGRGSEFVVGDVWERHAEDLAGGMDRRAAERRLRRQAWRTVRGW